VANEMKVPDAAKNLRIKKHGDDKSKLINENVKPLSE